MCRKDFPGTVEMEKMAYCACKIFWKNRIAPYKGKLEIWYNENRSLYLYLMLILLTGLTFVFKSNKLLWIFFPSIPRE